MFEHTLDAVCCSHRYHMSYDTIARPILPFEGKFKGMFPSEQQGYKHCVRSFGGCTLHSRFAQVFPMAGKSLDASSQAMQ